MLRWLLLCVALVSSCRKGAAEGQMVAHTKQILAEREKRLSSYRLEVESRSGDVKALHRFAFRSPNRMLGELLSPQSLTVAFDGAHLWKLLPKEKKRVDYSFTVAPAEASSLLASTFMPFVPEGFRTPLLPVRGVTARRVAHALEPNAVELTVSSKVQGQAVSTIFVLREASGDFLAKRIEMGTAQVETTVVAEHCDVALKLCVPTQLVERQGGAQVAVTDIKHFELNCPLANDGFSLPEPEGFVTEHQSIDGNSAL
jgi:outer membrane lipoprotein-sorting protein